MSAKEAKMLDELRAKELKRLSDSEYKLVRNEVETKGIRALRGASAQIVFAALRERNKAMEKMLMEKASEKALQRKAEEHNAEVGDVAGKRTSASVLQQVYNRGVGAYRTNPSSVRPNVNSEQQWAMGRVNGFLHALRNGRFKRKAYDTDLLPKEHPLSSKGDDKKVNKHGTHDQKSHGRWSVEFGDEGEEYDTEGLHPRHEKPKGDDEGEFGGLNDDDMEAMDMMDILRPPKTKRG